LAKGGCRLRTAVVRGAVNPLASPAPACGRLPGAYSEAAKRLGVPYVLEGCVRKNGNAIRITAQLIDAKDGAHRTIDDIFAIQG